MAAGMAADTGHSLSAQAIEAKVSGLLEAGYPLSEEQIAAIRAVTSSGGRVAIIEGAAGSGKTTTLRPIADLYREHGQSIIATAVAWRTAVALGNDVDARPFCVDKLLRLAARGGIGINKDTTIIVDEAGMLSTRQAHHILQLSERHGAKIVFAGDTQQQQPVEAGPGLRLIRDAVGSVRVDRIRRQKADVEDILVHVHGETPEAARFRAGLMGEQERTRTLGDYEAMEDKPRFTPWQVAASEALRDGDAASAIAAHHARGRFHIGYDEEKTLTGLVNDWDRYQRANPDKSSVVLARTRAEVRALSHLMRERRFAALPDTERADADRVTVTVSRGTEDDRTASPLEIARGDRLRIGATHWEKQLFNGTVVTVDDFKIQRGDAGTEPSVLIAARTEDGRAVSFRHDEIRDWYGNIRLDHGYALTITSAQGLTVDRTFLLADARPARETIYPAATRHREGLDIYVNRTPLALDIADRRADNDREAAVTDTEIRAYLAERWSRSQPKEAALDYMADVSAYGKTAGRIVRIAEALGRYGSGALSCLEAAEVLGMSERQPPKADRASGEPDRMGPGAGRDGHFHEGTRPRLPAAANDNALAGDARSIAPRDIDGDATAFGWRHAHTAVLPQPQGTSAGPSSSSASSRPRPGRFCKRLRLAGIWTRPTAISANDRFSVPAAGAGSAFLPYGRALADAIQARSRTVASSADPRRGDTSFHGDLSWTASRPEGRAAPGAKPTRGRDCSAPRPVETGLTRRYGLTAPGRIDRPPGEFAKSRSLRRPTTTR